MKTHSLKKEILYSVLGTFFVIFCWFLFYLIIANDYLIPSPLTVIKQGVSLLFTTRFYSYFLTTFLRVIISLLISFILGFSLAFLSYKFKAFYDFISPLIAILRSLPVFSVLLIILMVFSKGIIPVIVCVLSLFPVIYNSLYNSLSKIDNRLIEMLKVYKVKKFTIFTKIYIKGIFPYIIKELLVGLSFALKLIVSAEIMLNVYNSIGGEIFTANNYSNTLLITALTLLVCFVGIVFELLGKYICYKMEAKYL